MFLQKSEKSHKKKKAQHFTAWSGVGDVRLSRASSAQAVLSVSGSNEKKETRIRHTTPTHISDHNNGLGHFDARIPKIRENNAMHGVN